MVSADPYDTENNLEVSVIIPCLNEARTVGPCIDKCFRAFDASGLRGEVIVADNGSTDGSDRIAEDAGAKLIRVFQKGYGNAILKGMEAAAGHLIIIGDADGTYDFSEMPRFVALWKQGYEMVMGNRFLGEIKRGAMPPHHQYLGTPLLVTLIRILFRSKIGDTNCGLRAFSSDLARRLDLRCTGMELASEMVIKAAKMNARITEVPVTLWPSDLNRSSHLRPLKDGIRHLRLIFKLALQQFFPLWDFRFHFDNHAGEPPNKRESVS